MSSSRPSGLKFEAETSMLTETTNSLPPRKPKRVRVTAISDSHGRRFKKNDIPEDTDILIFGGDFSNTPENQPDNPPDLGRLIRDLEHFRSLPGRYKVAVPGNHDLGCELAWVFQLADRHLPGQEPSCDRFTFPYTQEQLDRIKELTTSGTLPDGSEFIFLQHGWTTINIDGHKINIVGSGLSEQRRTSGYSINSNQPGAKKVWQDLFSSLGGRKPHIVVTHGAPRDDLTKKRAGSILLDRDSCDSKWAGSIPLADTLRQYAPHMIFCGHIHNAAGTGEFECDDGSKAMFCNASSIRTMYHPLLDREKRHFDMATMRPPWVFDYDPETGDCTVVQTNGDEDYDYPVYCAPIRAPDTSHLTEEQRSGLTDEMLLEMAMYKKRLEELTPEMIRAIGDRCDVDYAERTEALAREGLQMSIR